MMRGALLPPESAITSVFFRRRSPVTGAAHALALDILGEQSLASSRHGTGAQTEQIGDAAVTAVAELEGLQPGARAALAFVEQRAESAMAACNSSGTTRPPECRRYYRSGWRGTWMRTAGWTWTG